MWYQANLTWELFANGKNAILPGQKYGTIIKEILKKTTISLQKELFLEYF